MTNIPPLLVVTILLWTDDFSTMTTKDELIKELINRILRMNAHEDLVVPHHKFVVNVSPSTSITLQDFIDYGFTRSIGDLQGQIADYRLLMADGKSIHLRVFNDCFKLHWDYRDPRVDPWGHLVFDAPHWVNLIESTLNMVETVLRSLPTSK